MPTVDALKVRLENQKTKLAQTKARLQLAENRAKRKAKLNARAADAHRKIVLGGLAIAAGADVLDPAELCGALLLYLEKRTDGVARQVHEKGQRRLEELAAARRGRK